MKRSAYRKFKIESVKGPDDFASMREAVHRHYENVLEEDEASLPDLVLIDGGKGQLSAAGEALEDLGLERLPIAAIAKKEEIIFVRGREDEPIRLPGESPLLQLFQAMRDEAHRFAVTYHRKRRELRDFDSELLDIPGIGEVRRKVLLRAFGSLERVRSANFEELAPYVGPKAAEQIIEYFRRPQTG
jgi:excinuclease ABC subunit C